MISKKTFDIGERVGVNGDIPQLQSLHNEIDKKLAPLGFPAEKRKFTPHITIGRDIIFENGFDHVRNTIGKIEFAMTNVEGLFLFKSEQIRNRIIYSKVSEYILQNKIK